ncbi:hypothetical protein BDZ89DRAFT_798435 [Hymenopellis radicata]|nr:hypothetical protein BDZ89DRAFT_798435 [Hymenopellis radicata]
MSAKPIYSSDVEVAIVHDEDWITELGETTDSESDGISSRGPLSISKEPVVIDGVGCLKERPVAGSAPKDLALITSVHDSPLDFGFTHAGPSTFRLTDGSPVYPLFRLKAGTIYLRPVIPLRVYKSGWVRLRCPNLEGPATATGCPTRLFASTVDRNRSSTRTDCNRGLSPVHNWLGPLVVATSRDRFELRRTAPFRIPHRTRCLFMPRPHPAAIATGA